MGISGQVLKTGKICYSNDAYKNARFVPEIDNLSNVSDVISFLIAPVFGH